MEVMHQSTNPKVNHPLLKTEKAAQDPKVQVPEKADRDLKVDQWDLKKVDQDQKVDQWDLKKVDQDQKVDQWDLKKDDQDQKVDQVLLEKVVLDREVEGNEFLNIPKTEFHLIC